VGIGVIAYGLAFGIVRKSCGGGIVDVGLAVVGPWGLLDGAVRREEGGRKKGVPSQSELLGSSEMVWAKTAPAKREARERNFIFSLLT
jgi:hypothetical protein